MRKKTIGGAILGALFGSKKATETPTPAPPPVPVEPVAPPVALDPTPEPAPVVVAQEPAPVAAAAAVVRIRKPRAPKARVVEPEPEPAPAAQAPASEAPVAVLVCDNANPILRLPDKAIKIMEWIGSTLKPDKPSLQHARVKIGETDMLYFVTNLEEAICWRLRMPEQSLVKPFEMMLSLKCVKAISRVKGASDFQIQVVEDGFVRVVALASNRTVVSEQTFPIDADPDDFPSIPTWPTPTISVRGLRAAIDDVSAVTAPDAGRYAMNGVCIDFKRGNVVATDGKRLHLRHVPDLNQSRPEVVVPCGAQISRFVDTTLMMGVSISEDGRLIGAEFGPERMFDLEYYVFWQGCAIEGEFPPYMDVLPQHETWTVEWFMTPDEIKHLIGWIKSSGAMNSRELLAMIMEFTTEQISVMFRDPQQGTSRTTIHPKDLVARKAVEIGFNPRLLVDALSHPDVRRMCVKDAKSAAEIDGPDLRNIVMPIQVV